MGDKPLPKRIILSQERIYSQKNRFFPFRVMPIMTGGENGNGRVAAVESVLIYFNQGLFQMPLNCGQIADSVDHDHTAMAAF